MTAFEAVTLAMSPPSKTGLSCSLQKVRNDGTVSAHAFGWDAMGVPPAKAIPYRLEKDGQTIQEGKLRAVLRVSRTTS